MALDQRCHNQKLMICEVTRGQRQTGYMYADLITRMMYEIVYSQLQDFVLTFVTVECEFNNGRSNDS